LYLAGVAAARAEVSITDADYEGRPQFRIATATATWFYDKAGGGFSRLVDRDGKDWISFHKAPLKEVPASAAAGFRGLPNLLHGADHPDAGAGHPGFEQCESSLAAPSLIRTVTKSGRWAWSWRFTDETATLTIERADPQRPYWFLYEGTVGGRWSPQTHYWGADTGGPRRDTPDNRSKLFERWRWVYFGDDQSPRALLVAQVQADDFPDTLWYMGSSAKGLNSDDGMAVFGFGRAAGGKKHLLGAGQRFVVGFVEGAAANAEAHTRLQQTANRWLQAAHSSPTTAQKKPNVLLLVSDDLAATLGCYGHPQAKTPHLDSLAASGVLFERAYCQFPHCNPSRSSMLSGLRPHATRVTNNTESLYDNVPGVVTLPHLLRQHGYATARCGKIFHLGVPAGNESMDDPQAWDFGTPFKDERPYPPARESVVKVQTGPRQGLRWTEATGTDDDLVDGNFAKTAVEWLEKRDPSKPFFLAVGFHRPHLPLVAPAKYFDGYPLESITLPDAPADDEADIPLPARNGAVPGYTLSTTPDQRRAAIRGYLACVTYVDAQAGRVLEAIRRLGLADDTIVVFASDHGWHLGEHGLWHKRSLFEESARVPFLVFVPGAKANGRRCASLVELLDVYPTLCDLCNVPPPACGHC
jgi:uncharacterized sulfatase